MPSSADAEINYFGSAASLRQYRSTPVLSFHVCRVLKTPGGCGDHSMCRFEVTLGAESYIEWEKDYGRERWIRRDYPTT